MKVLRVIASSILGIIIFALLFALSISIVFKSVVEKEIIGNMVKEALLEDYIKEATDKDKEKIEDVFKEEDINTLINIILDEYTESVSVDNYQVKDETIDEIIELCVKHIDLINEFSDEKITEKDLRSSDTRNELTKSINKAFKNNDNDTTESVKDVIKVYRNVVSSSFRTAMIIGIIILTALIALINFSLYKWMKYLGGSLVSCGLLVSVMYVGLMLIIEKLVETEGYNIKANPRYVLILGTFEIILGIGLIVLNHVIKNKVKDNNKYPKNEFLAEKPKEENNSEM